MLWLYWLQSAAPWSIVFLVLAWKRRKERAYFSKAHKELYSFLLCWLISPMLLFSLAGNILPAYVLPGIPALGLLVSMHVHKQDYRWLAGVGAIAPVLLLIAIGILNMGKADSRSDRIIHEKTHKNTPAFYIGERPFSGQFYSRGQAKLLDDWQRLDELKRFYLVGKKSDIDVLISKYSFDCEKVFDSPSKRSLYDCIANE